jgi:L-malate glycosyltransferase
MAPRRICLLANLAGSLSVQWANHFHRKGYELHVFSFGEAQGVLEGIRIYRLRDELPFKLGYFSEVRRVRELVDGIRPSLIHAHYASGYGTLGRLLDFHPYIVSAWGSDIYEFPKKSPVHRWMLIRNLAAADYLCSTSRAMANELTKFTSKAVRITPFGVDCNMFSCATPSDNGETQFVVGTVRSLEKVHGIDCLLKAFALLMNKHPGWSCRLVIVGGGTMDQEYRRLARLLGLGDRVCFVGNVPHSLVAEYMRSFSVFAALSEQESFGVGILEASACGIPVVTSNVGGLPEVVVNEKTGLMVSPRDEVAAMQCLEKLYLSPRLRESLGRAGESWVREKYNWDDTASIMENLYEEVISTGNSSGRATRSENLIAVNP